MPTPKKGATAAKTTPAPTPAAPAAGAGKSLMAKLKASAAKPAVAPPVKGKQRQILKCETDAEIATLDGLTSADAVMKVAVANQSAAKQAAHTIFRRKFLEGAIRCGYMPENPTIQSPNSKANLIVKHMGKFKAVGSDGQPLDVASTLSALGFGGHIVTAIVGEVDGEGNITKPGVIVPKESLGLKKFTDLMADDATAAQKAVAEKVMGLLAEHLDDDEKALVLEQGISYEVGESWQDQAVGFARDGLNDKDPQFVEKATDRLEALFRVVQPQFVISHMNYSGELSGAFKQMQVPMPVVTTPIISDSPDLKYRAKIIGTEVHLFLVKPEGEQPLKVKPCKDVGHADATVKKWWRQPDSLRDFLAGAND